MERLKQYGIIILGICMISVAVSVFYVPNQIVTGGVSGISTILFYLFKIPPGLSIAGINLALLGIAYVKIGKRFVLHTFGSAMLMAVFVNLFSYLPPIMIDITLAALFGAVLYGVGIGLTLSQGSSSGGTDILGRLLQGVFPQIGIGKLLMAVDATIILTSLLLFQNVNLALWGVVTVFVSTGMVDWLIRKLNLAVLVFIVTKKGVELSKYLVETSPRGVTVIDAKGAYGMNSCSVLICALKEQEVLKLQTKIQEIDTGAFIIFSKAEQIKGEGFRIYR